MFSDEIKNPRFKNEGSSHMCKCKGVYYRHLMVTMRSDRGLGWRGLQLNLT